MDILEDGSGSDGPSRLDTPGTALSSGWLGTAEAKDADAAMPVAAQADGCTAERAFGCEVTLAGEAGPVQFTVAQLAVGEVVVPDLQQAITVLAGTALLFKI